MTERQPLDPEAYAIRYAFTRMVKPKMPDTFRSERYPVVQFRVWPEGTADTDDVYSNGANVSVHHLYASEGHAVGSIVTAIVYADGTSNIQHTTLGHGPYTPPLSLEMEHGVPSDDRTLRILQNMAVIAIEAEARLEESRQGNT